MIRVTTWLFGEGTQRLAGQRAGFRNDIEGFRAVAVLFVMAFHARLFCEGGFVGVDLFFVLSGYLITGLLTQEMEGTDGVSLGAFYARRVRRLLPAAFVLVVATAGTAFFLLSPLEQATLSRSVLASSAYLSNVYFYRAGRDYFASGVAANPLLHTWSLAVEEQFYLVWPLLILAVYRLRASRKAMCVAMGSLAVVSFAASIWITRINQPMSFYLTPFRAWEFAVGGLASQIPRAWLERRAAVVRAVGWIGLVVAFVSAFATTPQGFPGVKVLLPVLGAAGILVAGAIQDGRGVGRLLSVAPLPFLGQRSYALYLWHWPVLIFAGIYRDPLPMRERLLCLAAALAMADLSYRLVEHPIRSSGWVRRRTALCLGSAVALTAVGVAGGLAWRHWAVRTPNYKRFSAVVADLPEDVAQGCLTAYGDSTPRTCVFGSVETPTRTVVLMGDSHMEQWLPAFEAIGRTRGWKIVLLLKASCPAVDVSVFYLQGAWEDKSCARWRRRALATIAGLNPSAVILSGATWYTRADHVDKKVTTEEWREGARRTFQAMRPMDVPVISLRDTPFAGYDVGLCLARADWNRMSHCPALVRADALNDGIYAAQRAGAEWIPGVAFLDLSDFICGPVGCDLTLAGMVVYRDQTHLTATFARSLAGDLYRELTRMVPALATR